MIRSDATLCVLLVLSVARLTHLVTVDQISAPLRAGIARRAGRSWTQMAYLVQCPWCVSIWLGAGAAVATYNWHGRWWVQVPLLLLTSSYVAGLIEQTHAALLSVIEHVTSR